MLSTLSVSQYLEILDSRIILGINCLFYVTSLLPMYVSLCHITLFDVADDVVRTANLMIVINSSLKLPIYLCLSRDVRTSVLRLLRGPLEEDGVYHWAAQEDKSAHFLAHVKAAAVPLTDMRAEERNLCREYERE